MIDKVGDEEHDISPHVVAFLMREIAELRIINETILELLPPSEVDINVLISNRIKQKAEDVIKRLESSLGRQGL